MKTIFKAVATVTIFSIITRFLGFLFRIYLSRKLGSVGLGIFQIASSILGIFTTLVSSGLPLTTAKMVSKYEVENNLKKQNEAVSASLVIAILISCVSIVLILASKSIWNLILADDLAVTILFVLTPSILFSAIYSIFRGAIWGKSDFFNCGLTELVEQIVRFLLTFILLFKAKDYWTITLYSAIAFDATCLISCIVVLIVYFKNGRLNFRKLTYKPILKSALPITLVRLSNSFVQPLTSVLIPFLLIASGYTQVEALSSYGVVMGMTFPLLFVPMAVVGSISMVLVPKLSALLAKKDFNSINENLTQSLSISIFLSIMFVPLFLSVGDQIGLVLYDNLLSGTLLQLSAVCVLPITLCNLSGSILNALNLETKSFVNYLIGSTVLVLALIILTPFFGISAVCISYFFSMSTIALLNFLKIKKYLPTFSFGVFSLILKYLFAIIPSSLLGISVSHIFEKFTVPFISALFGGGIACASTLMLCLMFRIFDLTTVKELLKLKVNKQKNNATN